MDLDSTIATISDYLPEDLDQVISGVSEFSSFLDHAASYIPAKIDIGSSIQFMLYFAVASLILGVLGRVALGKRSSLNHSLSSAIGILFIYVLTVVVYTFQPWNLENFLSPLPFVTFSGDYLLIFPIGNAQLPALCSEILSLIILAFLVNLLDTLVPKGKNIVLWYLLRFITVGAAMVLHFVVRQLLHTYLPDVLVDYATTTLLAVLVFMLLSGVLSLILGLVISVANPFLGAMYTFFFSNVIGKQLSKAVFSSAILCAVIFILEYTGYTVICITAGALVAYIPLVILLLALWYLIGHIL